MMNNNTITGYDSDDEWSKFINSLPVTVEQIQQLQQQSVNTRRLRSKRQIKRQIKKKAPKVYVTKRGARYIRKVSKSGTPYKRYI
mgnify:CR=1 FL=1